jgi:hypothetical protein
MNEGARQANEDMYRRRAEDSRDTLNDSLSKIIEQNNKIIELLKAIATKLDILP